MIDQSPRITTQRAVMAGVQGSGHGVAPKALATQAPRRQPTAVPDATLQRFPATVHTQAFDWNGVAVDHAALGGGANSAIYKLTQQAPIPVGEANTVIVKALVPAEDAEVEFGETFLRAMGMATPNDRIVRRGEGEFTQLAALLGLANDADGDYLAAGRKVHAFLVMQDLGAQGADTIQSKMMAARSEEDVDEVFRWVTDPLVLEAVGKLIVFDSAIGNFDRITMDAQNFGNLMIIKGAGATQVFAIDTNARIPQIRHEILERAKSQGGYFDPDGRAQLLTGIFKNKEWAIGNWFDAIGAMVEAQQGKRQMDDGIEPDQELVNLPPYIQEQSEEAKAASKATIEAAFDQAITDLTNFLRSANKPDAGRQGVKGLGQGAQSWEALKAQGAYLNLRERSGLDHDEAAQIVEQYGRYRVSKKEPAVPVNDVLPPASFARMEFPSVLRNVLNTGRITAQKELALQAFRPDFERLRDNIPVHLALLEQQFDNVLELWKSIEDPGSNANQHHMVPLHKRKAEVDRRLSALQHAIREALDWATQYPDHARRVSGPMSKAKRPHAGLVAEATALNATVRGLREAAARLAAKMGR
ncbi:MAG: protein kinase family protein [Planctomycetota bacterium]